MRSYGQQCALAKTLDVIGDRWSLLIVRELLLQGPCRYTDLLNGLPGIATNLLSDRLRSLEQAGVLVREPAPPPVATTLFQLTDRGRALVPVIREMGRWGAPFVFDKPVEGDEFRGYWIALPLELYYVDTQPDLPPVRLEVHMDEHPMVVETVDGKVRARAGREPRADAVIHGEPRLVMGLFNGRISLREAQRQGLRLTGDRAAVRRIGRVPDPEPISRW